VKEEMGRAKILRHGSLFSGIGGFDLAAEWMGWKNVFTARSMSSAAGVNAPHRRSASGLLPTVLASDGARKGELVTGTSKKRSSGEVFHASLSDLARSGLLPTPTTGNNRNSEKAIQKIGANHQRHGVALGLAQVMEIFSGLLPKEFRSWKEVPQYYRRLTAIFTTERRYKLIL